MSEAQEFYNRAKEAGNTLRAYILSYASGATAVFFLALTGKDLQTFSSMQKTLLIAALLLYVLTAVICLYELHVDARRFFNLAKQLETDQGGHAWQENAAFRSLRLRLIYASYFTVGLATAAVIGFLVLRITQASA